MFYKQALLRYELREDEDFKDLEKFLQSENTLPDDQDKALDLFKNKDSALTITNITESFLERGEEYDKVYFV